MSRLALLILIVGVINRANAGTKTCTYTWVTPITGSAAGTYTVSIGAPLSMSVTIDNDVDNGDTMEWKSDTDVLTTDTAASGTFPATTTHTSPEYVTGFTAATSGAHTYTMSFPTSTGVPVGQDGKVITVANAGCTVASNGITLSVISCDLKAYGNLATAADQNACDYNCDREFTCATDSTKKFTAKCQADATWSVPYACDVCTSAGVKEVALLALVMLSSVLSATHLM